MNLYSFLRVFARPDACVSICPVMEISSLAALGASVTDLHYDRHL